MINDGNAIGTTKIEYNKSAGLDLERTILDNSECYESVNDTTISQGRRDPRCVRLRRLSSVVS